LARLLLLSNGHGEDLSGALLGKALAKLGHQIEALPLVGLGHSYSDAGIQVLCRGREFSTGGLGYTTLLGRFKELMEGQVWYVLKRILRLLFVADKYDLIVVVGDVLPVFIAWLSGRPVATYLVAYSSHYEGRLRLPWPCGYCLASRRFLGIYSRDKLTADDLTNQLGCLVSFLGNPFIEPALILRKPLPQCRRRLGLLPGSRRPELESNLILMLSVVELFPSDFIVNGEITLDMALVSDLDDQALSDLVVANGWELCSSSYPYMNSQLINGSIHINVQRRSFVEVLQSSDLLLCMAGTAAEQAISLAKPVLQLPGFGPQFTASFAEAQRRLLGPAIFCAEGLPGETLTFLNTAYMALDLLVRSKKDLKFQNKCKEEALLRLGNKGGANKIAEDITRLLNKC